MEARRAEVENSVRKRTHQEWGTIKPATMKVDDRQVYIVKGDVVMFPDGTAVDHNNSSESVIVCDAKTGEYEFVSPNDILRVEGEIDPRAELDAAFAQIDAESELIAQAGNADNITGTNDNITENDVSAGATQASGTVTNMPINGGAAPVVESALSRIPVDENGKPQFHKAESVADAWDALNEKTGDEEMSLAYAEHMTSQAKKALDKAKKAKVKQSDDLDEFIANESARKQAIADAEQTLAAWTGIAGEPGRRKAEAQRIIDEQNADSEPQRDKQRDKLTSAEGEDSASYASKLFEAISTIYSQGKEFANKLYQRSFFDVVKTPDFMKRIGLTGEKFTIRYGVISRHIGKDSDHKLPIEIWKQIPDAIKHPFAISEHYEANKDGEFKQKGFRIYLSIEHNGKPVIIGATVKNGGPYIEVNSIDTVFAVSKPSELEKFIYRSENISPEQQSLLDGRNSHQYPATREISEGKVNTSLPDKQYAGKESSGEGAVGYGETYSHDGGAFQVENTPVIVDGREIGLKSVMTGRGKQTTEFVMHVPYEIDSEVSGRRVESDDNGEGIIKFDSAEEMAEFWKRNDVAKAIEEALKETKAKQTPVDNTVTDPQKLSEAVKERGGELEDGDIDFEVGKSYPLADGGKMMVTAINGWEVTARIYDKDGNLQRTVAEPARVLMRLVENDGKTELKENGAGEQPIQPIQPHTAGSNVKEKWDNAHKEYGFEDEIILADGTKIEGRWVLAESGSVTPSHDATKGFAMSEGYPVDEYGKTTNDRDYAGDKNAQEITRGMAANYDGRAVQSPVVVTKEGVVLSGNGRSMAGELAAENNTDGEYIDFVTKHADKKGFSAEQVAQYKHPRLVFETSTNMELSAATMAKFNAKETKSKSTTEDAIAMGKVVDDRLFGRILNEVDGFNSMTEFYASKNATEVIKDLRNSGVISEVEMAEMFDGDAISEAGRKKIENVLLGRSFSSNENVLRMASEYKSIRDGLIKALRAIVSSRGLGNNYSLEQEIADAIELVYQARSAGYKHGSFASEFARQGTLFEEYAKDFSNPVVQMLADALNSKGNNTLRNMIDNYIALAKDAAQGQIDIFTGDVKTKDEIIQELGCSV